MTLQTLIDGRQVDASSEDWRHECEARAIAALKTVDERRARIAGIESKRGKPEADRLRATIRALWKARE